MKVEICYQILNEVHIVLSRVVSRHGLMNFEMINHFHCMSSLVLEMNDPCGIIVHSYAYACR